MGMVLFYWQIFVVELLFWKCSRTRLVIALSYSGLLNRIPILGILWFSTHFWSIKKRILYTFLEHTASLSSSSFYGKKTPQSKFEFCAGRGGDWTNQFKLNKHHGEQAFVVCHIFFCRIEQQMSRIYKSLSNFIIYRNNNQFLCNKTTEKQSNLSERWNMVARCTTWLSDLSIRFILIPCDCKTW